jgi:hypothetical protein
MYGPFLWIRPFSSLNTGTWVTENPVHHYPVNEGCFVDGNRASAVPRTYPQSDAPADHSFSTARSRQCDDASAHAIHLVTELR